MKATNYKRWGWDLSLDVWMLFEGDPARPGHLLCVETSNKQGECMLKIRCHICCTLIPTIIVHGPMRQLTFCPTILVPPKTLQLLPPLLLVLRPTGSPSYICSNCKKVFNGNGSTIAFFST